MNAKFLYAATVAIALIASTAAMATEATQFNGAASERSRADIKAELAVARAQGNLTERGESYGTFRQTAPGTLSRAEVRAEAARANREQRVPSSVYGYLEPVNTSLRSREEVRAEALAEARSASMPSLR